MTPENKYCSSFVEYKRLATRSVKIGELFLGSDHPIRIQTMTTTNTNDVQATVAQAIRCIEAGAELIRITAPSQNEAHNLLLIKNELRKQGYKTPLVADIHFTPSAAEIAARIVEKVRINPGNFVDKKKFQTLQYTDTEYQSELSRIRERFVPLIHICKEYGTALRIGANHGSLSDRIMSRYGDTPMGMVESAMEFMRIARDENFHQLVLSMKSSNPQVMVQAYRLLVQTMMAEWHECYPLHLGVTEAGDGEDGRIKSAMGIGALLEEGIGDTIRVSLTEEPEFEIPVCKQLIQRLPLHKQNLDIPEVQKLFYSPYAYKKRETIEVNGIGKDQVPIVISDLSNKPIITTDDFADIGYHYLESTDKWESKDMATDFIFVKETLKTVNPPQHLKFIVPLSNYNLYQLEKNKSYYPILTIDQLNNFIFNEKNNAPFVEISSAPVNYTNLIALIKKFKNTPLVWVLTISNHQDLLWGRRLCMTLLEEKIQQPFIVKLTGQAQNWDDLLIDSAVQAALFLLEGWGNGLWINPNKSFLNLTHARSYRLYEDNASINAFVNFISFAILQAARVRITKTEYISCPSCGRTLFNLQEVTTQIRQATNHLKGLKIAIMGCIVNGPGEMADADFGYVGSGNNKISLYKGKEIVKKNINSAVALSELIALLKESGVWIDKEN
ncbi:MAG: (E)-4-hydroxy-3-methylbut-2-enyl-diphosphate synthase [Phycisphaerales bacterium]|nr:(E)-4-hydroxy-3-methylbut-2-enyl-diphosphate synthase [Phycisphaerales bacterium]